MDNSWDSRALLPKPPPRLCPRGLCGPFLFGVGTWELSFRDISVSRVKAFDELGTAELSSKEFSEPPVEAFNATLEFNKLWLAPRGLGVNIFLGVGVESVPFCMRSVPLCAFWLRFSSFGGFLTTSGVTRGTSTFAKGCAVGDSRGLKVKAKGVTIRFRLSSGEWMHSKSLIFLLSADFSISASSSLSSRSEMTSFNSKI
mmetsp:Transcript_36259/g.45703  ORF Transcript_36259/g.45703 Transcript_36259/m.45703 type:complete len:200 (-) Transcript_36259:1093-1692(-)